MPVVRILVAEHEPFARLGLRELLSQRPGLWVPGAEAVNTVQALALAPLIGAGIAIVNHRLPSLGGEETCRQLTRQGLAVVVLSGNPPCPRQACALADAGAFRCVSLADPVSAITDALEAAITGNPELATRMRSENTISIRELQVARLLIAGLRNRRIAERLGVSIRTVESHREKIRAKLGVDSISDLARLLHSSTAKASASGAS